MSKRYVFELVSGATHSQGFALVVNLKERFCDQRSWCKFEVRKDKVVLVLGEDDVLGSDNPVDRHPLRMVPELVEPLQRYFQGWQDASSVQWVILDFENRSGVSEVNYR